MFDEGNQRGGQEAKMDRLALLSAQPPKRDTGHPHRLIITSNRPIQFLPPPPTQGHMEEFHGLPDVAPLSPHASVV